ncbi:MAG: ribosome assembly factor SBDS [Candidatus Pacearchaeota archaeon]|jgi:ribosome maturation protein SDO1
MTDTVARLRKGSMIFETMVNLEAAMKLKKGEKVDIAEIIRDNAVYTDLKKGMRAGKDVLISAFETDNFPEIVEKIVKRGELEVTQEFRDEAVEQKRKQIIDFLVRNAVDARTNRPFTPDMIQNSLKQAGVKIDKQPIERQIKPIITALTKIIPIKIASKKIKVIIPAVHTGRAYGIVQEYKEREDWLANGDLEVILNIPVGIQTEFYDRLNGVTHGSAITQEMKVEEN